MDPNSENIDGLMSRSVLLLSQKFAALCGFNTMNSTRY